MKSHELMGGKVRIYKRDKSNYWQCSAFFGGKRLRTSTKEESLSLAKEYAEDWYLDLKVKHKRGELKNEKTFEQAARQFLREFEIITEGERSDIYVKGHKRRVEKYLIPFFGDKGLSEITSGSVQEYRIHRKLQHQEKHNRSIGHSTIHQEVVCIRQVLKTAVRHNWLSHIPDLSKAYQGSTKISHRAWFSADEYKSLYEATRRRANNPPHERWRREYEQIHDFVLFMANTGLRPDEAYRLQYRDVDIVEDESTRDTILEIEVRGKRGVGYCKSMPGAVRAFQRLYDRNEPAPSDLVFPSRHTGLFNTILNEMELKHDREGNPRTAYSLRHTYICLRLIEGADIYQVAKNCRTSVEMIEKYYASHIKNMLDASAINVRRKKVKPKLKKAKAAA